MTVTDVLRKIFKNTLTAVSSFLLKIGLTPNFITLTGLVGTMAAAVLIAKGNFFCGGIIAAIMGALDAVDGAMARLSGVSGKFGCLLDSLVDRYSEMVLLLGILINFTFAQNPLGIIFVYLALCGSFLVSYIRARAEGLGLSVKIGMLTRVERLIFLVISLLIGRPLIGVVIIAVLSNLTAIQRFCYARSILKDSE
ncbi:MAG: CDP-alcohol phosphatidyltransferase family protein [Pelolinea sp.]|nr:CDP-alcohol phosphatidyltransferase family protein [Pelolinea sp.]